MLLYFIFSITYRKEFTIYSSKKQYQLPSFGFDANGTYYIEVDKIPEYMHAGLQIAFLNRKQYKSYFFKFFPPSICDLQDNEKFYISANNNILQGTFSEKIELYPFLLRCNSISDTFSLKITTEYRNPTTYLDNRMVNGIYGEITTCILYFIFLVAWFINWFRSSPKQNGLHHCITAIILLFSFSHILRFFELQRLNHTDNSNFLTNARILLRYLGSTFCCYFILLASEGYCILTDTINNQRKLIKFIVSSIFSASLFLTVYFNDSESYNKIFFLSIFCFVFYGYEFYTSIKRANLQLATFLLSSSNSESNSETVEKNKLFNNFQKILIVILVLIIVILTLNHIAFLIQNWLVELFENFIEITVIAITAFLFRAKKKKNDVIFGVLRNEGLNRRLIDDNDDSYSIGDDEGEKDEIPLVSIESTSDYLRNAPTPDQPLLQESQNAKSDKKSKGKKFSFI